MSADGEANMASGQEVDEQVAGEAGTDVTSESGIASGTDQAEPAIVLPDEEDKREKESSITPEEKKGRLEKSKLVKQGANDMFRSRNYESAMNEYLAALSTCPIDESSEFAILYSNLAAALVNLSRHNDAVNCLNRAVNHNPNYVKAYLRRAKAYEHLEKLDEALEDYKKIVELDPGVHEARKACVELPPKIAERNERLKNEMIDKLKGLGDMFLRPFGLSTNNFELKQDPATGSYSVNMKK